MTRSLRDQFSTMRFLHGVLFVPIAFYGGMAFLIAHPSAHPPIDPDLLLAIFGGISVLGVFVVIPLLRKRLLPERPDGPPLDLDAPVQVDARLIAALGKLRVASIVTWALAESPAMFGLMIPFLGGPAAYYLPLAGVALVGLLVYRPTRQLFDGVIRGAR
jgi:hypothetical protein